MHRSISGGASLFIVENKHHVEVKQPEPKHSEKGEGPTSDDTEESPEKKPSFFAAVKVFKDPRFLLLSLAELAASIGFLIPLYYMQSK